MSFFKTRTARQLYSRVFFLKRDCHFHSRCNIKEARHFSLDANLFQHLSQLEWMAIHSRTSATRRQAHEYMVTWQQHPRVQNRRNRNSNENKMSWDRSGRKPRQERPVAELADAVLTIEVLPSGLLVPSDMQVPVTGTAACEPGLA